MKPRIYRRDGQWHCRCAITLHSGATPVEAYDRWRKARNVVIQQAEAIRASGLLPRWMMQ
jgi:hypothetical protein